MDRYGRYVEKRTAERHATILAGLRAAISLVQARGEFPSMQRVRRELEDPCWMLEKWVRAAWRRIAEELGVFRALAAGTQK
jgi:hypothetical protein